MADRPGSRCARRNRSSLRRSPIYPNSRDPPSSLRSPHGSRTGQGQKIRLPISPLNRTFRLVVGLFLGLMGLASSNWLVLGLGALISFWGVYDRCPIWRALTSWIDVRKGS